MNLAGTDCMTINRNRKDTYRTKKRQEQNKTKGFFAYPSHPEDRVEIIEKSITTINRESKTIKLTSWKDMEKNSSRIISNILETISDVDFFCG